VIFSEEDFRLFEVLAAKPEEVLSWIPFCCQMLLSKSKTILDLEVGALLVRHMVLEMAWVLTNVCYGPQTMVYNLFFVKTELSYGQ
jgi:hypothetical protein